MSEHRLSKPTKSTATRRQRNPRPRHTPSIVRSLPADEINPISFDLARRFLAGEKIDPEDRRFYIDQINFVARMMRGMNNPTIEELYARRAEIEAQQRAVSDAIFAASAAKYILPPPTEQYGGWVDTRHNPP